MVNNHSSHSRKTIIRRTQYIYIKDINIFSRDATQLFILDYYVHH